MKKHVVHALAVQAKLRQVSPCKSDRLPHLTPCYCSECKKPLSDSRIMDERNGWCPSCMGVVATSWFQAPSWAMGGLVFIFTTLLL